MIEVRVYSEDTDAGGVVYHASYLRFLERGRVEFLRDRGASVGELHRQGYILPVMRLEIDYLASAVPDDLLQIKTRVLEIASATFLLGQQVLRAADGRRLVDGKVTLVCVGPGMKVRRLPKELLQALGKT